MAISDSDQTYVTDMAFVSGQSQNEATEFDMKQPPVAIELTSIDSMKGKCRESPDANYPYIPITLPKTANGPQSFDSSSPT